MKINYWNLYKFFCLIITSIVLASCTVNQISGDGNVLIKTPSYAPLDQVISKSIGGYSAMSLSQFVAANQDKVRYEICVESNGQRLSSIKLSNNETSSITVPSGINLDIGIGVYLAKNSSTNEEMWNSYLVSDVEKDVFIKPGETKSLTFTLDYTNPTKVTTYFPIAGVMAGAPGIADIISGMNLTALSPQFPNLPLFSVVNLDTSNITNVNFDGTSFNNITINSGGSPVNNGLIFSVTSPSQPYWVVGSLGGNYNIFETNGNVSGNIITSNPIAGLLFDFPADQNRLLPKVFTEYSIQIGTNNDYYFCLDYGDGFFTTRHNPTNLWYEVKTIDMSYLSFVYPAHPFLLDVQKGEGINDVVFATTIGTYFIDQLTLNDFSDGDKERAVSKLKKMLIIPDTHDPRLSQLITNVESDANNLFLGTNSAVYKINKNTSAWQNFANLVPSSTEYISFPAEDIEKIAQFYNEPITSMKLASNNVLIVTTPHRIYFKNISTGNASSLSVWDGIPFVPLNAYSVNFTELPHTTIYMIYHRSGLFYGMLPQLLIGLVPAMGCAQYHTPGYSDFFWNNWQNIKQQINARFFFTFICCYFMFFLRLNDSYLY